MTTINDPLEALRSMLAIYLDHTDGDLQDSIKKVINHIEKQGEPKPESLFGRWATRPDHGRGIITSDTPRFDGKVVLTWKDDTAEDGTCEEWVFIDDLTIDPATLTTVEDYQNAPVGTIVEDHNGDVYVGDSIGWHTYDGEYDSKEMAGMGTSRIIRWGTGK